MRQRREATPPSGATAQVLEQAANVYEGLRIGKFELRGMKIRMPPDADVKVASFRLTGLENGRLAEFALEGLDGQSPKKDPLHVGRFALKGLHVANLMRQSSQLAETAGMPSKDQAIGLLTLLEGIEIDDVDASSGGAQQTVHIDNFRLSWGQFVGPIPTNVRLSAKTTVPTNLADMGAGGLLSGTGLDKLTTSVDLGVLWIEAAQTLDISPAAIELVNSFAFTAKLSIRNVPRSMFSTDTSLAMGAVDQLETGR